MEPNENETAAFEVPPPTETPATWGETTPRYFGVTPHGLAAVIAAFAFGAGVVLLASGYVLAGVLLLVAAALLAAIFAEQARRRRDSAVDRVAAAAGDHTRAHPGFNRSAVRSDARPDRGSVGCAGAARRTLGGSQRGRQALR